MHRTFSQSTATRFGDEPLLTDTRIFHRRVRPAVWWTAMLVGLLALLVLANDAGARAARQDSGDDSLIAARQFVGAAKRDGVVVRSGPTTGHLGVMTLTLDQEVIVVGADVNREFLRILPPQGAFCLVPKARVNLRGDTAAGGQKIGRVTETCSVKAGSRINSMPGETTQRLTAGEEVVVIGEDATFYHIEPPRSVFFYVQASDLRRGREVKVSDTASGWRVGELPAEGSGEPVTPVLPVAGAENRDSAGDGQQTSVPANADQMAGETTGTSDATEAEAMPEVVLPTTRPALLTELRELDARYIEAAGLPIEEQPLEQLQQEYTAILARVEAEPSLEGFVESVKSRLESIDLRQQLQQDKLALQAMREEQARRQQSLQAENQELEERAQAAKISVYAALGQLRPSTLQVGGGSLFRLCDPATGRTLIYLRAEGDMVKTLAAHLEKFIGVRGETVNDKDMAMKFIKVAEVSAVDQAQVFKSVAAEIIPPSLAQNAGAGN